MATDGRAIQQRCTRSVPERAMAVFAHPDDAEFTCGGTVASWTRAGAAVVYAVGTNGEKGDDDISLETDRLVRLRREEQRDAARLLGVAEVHFLGYPDGALSRAEGIEERLAGLIRQARPQMLLTWDPWKRYQLHPDHRAAGFAALDAVIAAANPRMYPDQLTQGLSAHRVETVYLFGADEADVWIDVTDTFAAKLEAIALHRSQVRDREEVARWMSQCNRDYGAQAGCAYAETFKLLHPFCQL